MSRSSSRCFSSLVSWEIDADSNERVGIITLKSPQTYNALTVEMGRDFEALVSRLEGELTEENHDGESNNVGAIVLCGQGDKAFSAGGDLVWLQRCAFSNTDTNTKRH